MASPTTSREALLAETLGELGRVLDRVETLLAAVVESSEAFLDARTQLAGQLAAFEARVGTITQAAQVQAVKHILARTDEAARRSIEQQGRAMTEAARVALGSEIGTTMRQLRDVLPLLLERRGRRWEQWLVLVATAAIASTVTWSLFAWPWLR